MSKNTDRLHLSRRNLLKATGGLAGTAALSGPLSGFGRRDALAQDNVTVSIWGNHPEWKDSMREILDAFEAATPGVKVDLAQLIPSNDYGAKKNTSISGKETADILGMQEGDIVTLAPAGGELPFTDLTGKVDVSGLTDIARGQVEVGGKVYGCPLAAYTVGLAINNKVFAEHSLTPPTTWDELKTVSQALKDAGVIPIALGGKDWIHPYFMYIGFASSVLGVDGFAQLLKGGRKLSDPDVVAAAQLLIDLMPFYNKGFEAIDYTVGKALFAQGKAAMQVAGTTDFTGYRTVNPNADLSFIAWPGPEAGKKATTTGLELIYTVSAFASPEKQDAATKFVAWLTGTEAQQLVADKLSLPVNKAITESSDPVRAQTVAAAQGADVAVWYDLPEVNGSVPAVQENHGGLWTGRLTAQQFSDAIQASVKPSAA